MIRLWQLVAVLVLAIFLATPGFARSGNGEAKGKQNSQQNQGKKKGKKSDRVTSVSLGEIVISDERIVDLSGNYDLTSGTAAVDLAIVQDERGRLIGTADVAIPDVLTSLVEVTGRLRISGRDGDLSFRLSGCVGETSATDDDASDADLSSHKDSDSTNHDDDCTTAVNITGELDGSAFGTEICITTASGTVCYDLRDLVPVNTIRGTTISEPMDEVRKGKGQVIFSDRLIELPWGTETVRAIQVNTPNGFQLILNGGGFHLQMRGDFDSSGEVDLDTVRLNLGYGKLDVDPDDVEVDLP